MRKTFYGQIPGSKAGNLTQSIPLPPSKTGWILEWFCFQLNCDASVANRAPILVVSKTGMNNVNIAGTFISITASQATVIAWCDTAGNTASVSLSCHVWPSSRMPAPGDGTLGFSIVNGQAGDVVTAVSWQFVEAE